ncbi:MAG: hypothetical protein M0006_02285 [Magnetospirillum sp.]|nr:hypothetical protein [Magnetospirillum sp.]
MGDHKLQIRIGAKDEATSVIRKVGRSLGFLKPADASATLGGGGARLASASRSLLDLGRSAGKAAESIAAVAAPMAAITGGASLAGTVALASHWAEAGRRIANTAEVTGVSARNLQRLGGAARLSGLSADSMTGSLSTLGRTMQDASAGRNQNALVLFGKLGLVMRRTKDGAMDAADMLRQVSDAVRRQTNPQTQATILDAFGIDRSLLPLLRQGGAGVDALADKAERLGSVMSDRDVAAAKTLQGSFAGLGESAIGVSNAIGAHLAPVLRPLADKAAAWTAKNKDMVASIVDIGGAALTAAGGVKLLVKALPLAAEAGPLLAIAGALAALKAAVGFDKAHGGVGSAASIRAAMGGGWADKVRAWLGTDADGHVHNWKLGEMLGAAGPWLSRHRQDIAPGIFGRRRAGAAGRDMARGFLDALSDDPDSPFAPGSGAPMPIVRVPGSSPLEKFLGRPRGMPLGLRLNNPGNLRQWGTTPVVGGFAAFPSSGEGLSAMAGNLLAQQDRHGVRTLAALVRRIAPASDGNDVDAYVRDMSGQTGFAPNERLNLHDPSTLKAVMAAMIRHEQGRQPFTDAQIAGAVASRLQVEVTVHGLPPGAHATAKVDGAGAGAPRIGSSMPNYAVP